MGLSASCVSVASLERCALDLGRPDRFKIFCRVMVEFGSEEARPDNAKDVPKAFSWMVSPCRMSVRRLDGGCFANVDVGFRRRSDVAVSQFRGGATGVALEPASLARDSGMPIAACSR